ncbi:IclR family transcriptional regulator [Dictyobacter aurantiacus]|uniref:IclR family transcriptional regulator n=1 Tax=Dictyobacter aurantiacus TaxID=1936993 RepID=A0A401ZLA9_9CHLR|nr:IclR family transcriptional regulator [Dictyobacter aurantiacus]GCE07657.1 IclR family transcriptional regulator [Dictyobacter aurantiacus]
MDKKLDDIDTSSSQPAYHVPALEKGLDILECLAAHTVPLTQAQLARLLGRGASELFRMLTCLERRRYIQRDPVSGAYSLTLRLFELGHTHSPYQGLLRAAARPMRELVDEINESCHLSVVHQGRLVVLAQEENHARLRLSVEVGGTFPLLHTASGRLLLAHMSPVAAEEAYQLDEEYASLSAQEREELAARLDEIRARGYEYVVGESNDGVQDLVLLVGSQTSHLQAALAICSLSRRHVSFLDTMLPPLRHCADAIASAAGIVV